VLNAITPQTETTSWYFYGFCRNFAVGDEDTNDTLRENLAVCSTRMRTRSPCSSCGWRRGRQAYPTC